MLFLVSKSLSFHFVDFISTTMMTQKKYAEILISYTFKNQSLKILNNDGHRNEALTVCKLKFLKPKQWTNKIE